MVAMFLGATNIRTTWCLSSPDIVGLSSEWAGIKKHIYDYARAICRHSIRYANEAALLLSRVTRNDFRRKLVILLYTFNFQILSQLSAQDKYWSDTFFKSFETIIFCHDCLRQPSVSG